MRKISMLLVGLIAFLHASMAQQVEREYVILEIGTGTWCQYCPGAAMGADDLIENGHDVAIIEYHGGDIYENSFSAARLNYYNVSSYPTSKFDGTLTVSGGSNNESMYSSFLPKYEQRKAINSSFTIDVEGTCDGQAELNLTVTLNKVADYSGNNIALHCVVTESEIEQTWQGQSELNFVARTMAPNANGTTVDFSSSDQVELDLTALLGDEWVYEHLELVLFLQDKNSKEILQAFKAPLTDYPTTLSHDAAVKKIEDFAEQNCSGTASPEVTIINYGLEALTSVDIHYSVNGGEEMISNWTGNLAPLETEKVQLEEITFDVQQSNTLVSYTENPNGNEDQYADNNQRTISSVSAQAAQHINLILKTDSDPEETTWEIANSSGDVVLSGGPYTQAGSYVIMNEQFAPEETGCYSFRIYDTGGNGISNGAGLLMINDHEGEPIFQGKTYGSKTEIQFTIDPFANIETIENITNVQIYPNPVTEQTQVYFNTNTNNNISVVVYDAYGKQITAYDYGYRAAGSITIPLDIKGQSSGVYFVRIQSGNTYTTQRVIVK